MKSCPNPVIQLNDNEFWNQLNNNKQILVNGLKTTMPSYHKKPQDIITAVDEQTYRTLVRNCQL